MNPGLSFVGIDISKDRLDVAVRPQSTTVSYSYDKRGMDALVRDLTGIAPEIILLEATGGYEAKVIAALVHAKLPVILINPRQVREFAKATGRLAKTDRIDARVLAHFAEAVRPQPRSLPDEEQQELSALMTRRFQIIEMIGMERNRLGTANKRIKSPITKHIQWLEKQLDQIDTELDNFIHNNPTLHRKVTIIKSVPGVGPVLSRALVCHLPELGNITNKQISALAGLAPFNCDSGKHVGKRKIWGGRQSIRAALYMAALVASRHNPVISSFYQRLLKAGKAKKLALTACMRKLLTILNAMVRKNRTWEVKTA